MAHSSSDPSRMNQQSPHEGRGDDESWKTRPSTETTSDEGTNARVARERKVAENAPRTDARPKTSRLTPLKVRSQLEARIARIERDIAALDRRKEEIDALFADPATYQDRARSQALQAELSEVTQRSDEAVRTWERLLAELEAG